MPLFFKKKKKTIQSLLDSIEKEPNNPSYYIKLSDLYLEEKKEQEAISLLFKAAKLFEGNSLFSQAIAIYKKIEKINPHHPQLKESLENFHIKTSEFYTERKTDSQNLPRSDLSLLYQGELFSSLDYNEFLELIKNAKIEKFIPGQIIISEGEKGEALYFLLSGKVKIITKSEGKSIDLGYLEENDFFGEVSILTNKPRTATVIGMTNGELLIINKKDLQEAFQKNPTFKNKIEEFYKKRVYDTIDIFLKKLK